MAAITETRRSGGLGCVWVILLAVLAAVVLLGSIDVPDVGPIETGDHATDRHGADAELVRREIAAGGGSHYNCNDGKEYIIKRLSDGRWALMVVRDGREVTSFLADQDYVKGRLENENCSNGWSHP
jgi:hypothetical protein